MRSHSANGNHRHYDSMKVKSAAQGREIDILANVAGIPREYLSSVHGPCPKCGGRDRWRVFDDGTGGAICNQCLRQNNGDYIAVTRWYCGWEFPETISRIAEYLGLEPTKSNRKNGKPRTKSKPQKSNSPKVDQWKERRRLGENYPSDFNLVGGLLDRNPGVSYESLKMANPLMVDWPYRTPASRLCVAFEFFNAFDADPCGYAMMKCNGLNFDPVKEGRSPEKKRNLKGSTEGFLFIGGQERFKAASTVWKCEGPTDALALAEKLPADHVAITTLGGAKSKSTPVEMLAGKVVYVVHDSDQAGQDGAITFAGQAAHYAAEVRNVQLPYEIEPDHGKDLRDWINEGGAFEKLLELVEGSEPVEPAEQDTTQRDEEDWLIDIGKTTPTRIVLSRITQRLKEAGDVFRRESLPIQIRGDSYTTITTNPELSGVLSQTSECGYVNNAGDLIFDSLPAKFGSTWLNNRVEIDRLPNVAMFTRNPVYTDDWNLVSPGYDPYTEIYYAGEKVEPTSGTHHLDNLLRDFCWKSPSDRTNYIGLMLTVVLINHFIGSKPGGIFNGNQPELGKSVAAQILAIIRDGRHVETCSYSDNDEEFEKRLGARVRAGATTIIIDNAKGNRGRNCVVDSGCLERSITDPVLSYRLLTRSEEIRAENSHLFCITVNAAEVSRDIVTRCIPINFYHEGEPSARRFSITDPEGYAVEHRWQLLAELLGMVERWKSSGMPMSDAKSRFNKKNWGKIIGGILV